jgi:hypothetical protein
LEFLIAQTPNLIVRQGVGGESQLGEEVCMTLSVESETRGVRWVLKISDIGEGQGCPLCKEGQDLFQCSIGCEESKMLNNLSDREFFVGVSTTE